MFSTLFVCPYYDRWGKFSSSFQIITENGKTVWCVRFQVCKFIRIIGISKKTENFFLYNFFEGENRLGWVFNYFSAEAAVYRWSSKKLFWKNKQNSQGKLYAYTLRESVCIQSFSAPYFPAFGLSTEGYSLSLHIQSQCSKIRSESL